MYTPKNALSLTAIPVTAQGGQPVPDGQQTQSGIHLRWSFDPELGYPRNGFALYRGITDVSLLTTWSFDLAYETLLSVHADRFPGYADFLAQRYGFDRVLEQIFEQLQSLRPVDIEYHRWLHKYSEAEKKKAQISKLDSILLAATDPHIARFAGLYYVDDQLPTTDGELLRYLVVGDWGEQHYPKKTFDLKNTPQKELGLSIHKAGLDIIAGGGYFQNTRFMPTVDESQAYNRIWYRGAAGRTLSFVLDEPVEVFRLQGSFSSVGTIFLDNRIYDQPISSTRIEISSPDRPFTRVDLLMKLSDGIHLDELHTRRKSGSIGVLISPIYYWSSFLHEVLVAGIEPQMGNPLPEPATPILDSQGRLALPKSQIVLPATYYNPSLSFPLQPLAYIFGKTLGSSEQAKPQFTLNDYGRAPALRREPKELLPDLAAWFKLDDSYTEAKTKDTALPHGKLRFAKTGIGPERIPIDEKYPGLRTIGERALCFDGNSYLNLVSFPDLQNLAGDFTISLRCFCGRFNIGTTRTLLGSDTEEGLFIGISPVGDVSEQLQLHLRIGDTVIEQPHWRFVNTWQTISLVVRHGRGQIYLNYSPLGTEFPFPAEKNRFTGRTLCLGGAPNAPANRNFRGYLADVQFWHRAIDPRTAALKLAQQADLLSQHLPLRPAFQVPETLTFDAQNRWRRFVQPDLRELSSFSIQFWIKPVFTPGQSLVVAQASGNNGINNGIGIALNGIDRKLYFKTFSTNWQYQTDEWTHVCITYDCMQLKFFINGYLDTVHNFPYRFNASDNWFHLGADNTGAYPYQGQIADFRIYKLPLPPTALKMHGPILHYPQIHTFQSGDVPVADYSLALASIKEQMAIFFWVYPDLNENITEPYTDFKKSKLKFQVYSLADNGKFNEFFIALIRTNYFPQGMFILAMGLGEEEYLDEKIVIQSRAWTHIGISWDGEKISFFINGLLVRMFVNESAKSISIPPALGLKKFILQLGNKLLLPEGNNRYSSQFIGQIADFQIWDQAISPTELRDHVAPPYFTDTNIDDGTYTYYVQGIGMWGEKSNWSLPRTVEVKSNQTFHAPTEVKAAFLPIRGAVEQVTQIPKNEDTPKRYEVSLKLNTPFSGTPGALIRYEALLSRRAMRSDGAGGMEPYQLRQPFEISNAARLDNGHLILTLNDRPFAQLNPLPGDAVIIAFDQDYVVSWAWTGIQQLYNPAVNRFLIHLKSGKWNELTAPILGVNPAGESRFVVQTNLNLPPEEFIGEYASVENRIYKIKDYTEGRITLDFGGDPVIAPPVGSLLHINVPEISSLYTSPLDKTNYAHHFVVPEVTPFQAWEPNTTNHYQGREGKVLTSSEIEQLREPILSENWQDRGLDWLPEKNVVRLDLTGISVALPADMPTNRATSAEEAQRLRQNYVPGAVVAMCSVKGEWAHRIFYVFWHEVRNQPDGRLQFIAYLSAPEGDGPDFAAEDVSFPGRAPTRFYYGRKFVQQLSLPAETLPSFANSPSQEFSVAIEATTNDRQIRGELSAKATLLAADRRLAAPGPKPTILRFGKPAFDGQADCMVAWDAIANALGYQLYRAVDTALFERDLEQRRKREAGSDYAEGSPETVFRDDPDFVDWFNAYRHRNPKPALANLNNLFAPRHNPENEKEINPLWLAAHPFWRAWADRYYPTLTDSEIEALANRPGNESAFTIVHNEPLNPPVANGKVVYTDRVNGTVSNRYLYRVRVMGRNLQTGAWSKASAPQALRTPAAPPRAPVFTKVEAGDRQISLQWALNREPDLLGYTLYRAETEALLADLRWVDAIPIPGVTSILIPDPRIVTRWDEKEEAYILLPGDSPITSAEQILGIYRVEEFNAKAERVEMQPRAMNYRREVTVGSEMIGGRAYRKIGGLRKVAKGEEVIVVWRDSVYGVQVMTSIGEYPYVDRKVLGLKDYYYKIASLVALRSTSLRSDASEVMRAKALEIEPPPPPVILSHERIAGEYFDTVRLVIDCEEGLEVMVQYRHQGQLTSTTVLDWNNPLFPYEANVRIRHGIICTLKIWSRTSNKLVCILPKFLNI